MIHIFINALAASAGGGLTYVRNVVPHLGANANVRATVLLDARLRAELEPRPNLAFIVRESTPGAIRRAWFEQRTVCDLIRNSGANVLLSTGNFALWNSPVPQILLSRNSLYTSRDFFDDLRARGEYRLWLDTHLKGAFAKWSIQSVDRTVAPSQAFAKELQDWTGMPVAAIHHGFDREAFIRDPSVLPGQIRRQLDSPGDALRLLFVSHYNYYRNFETLIRALPLIRQQLKPRAVRLFLTCTLAAGANPGAYHPESAARLVSQLEVNDDIVQLGPVPYSLLHQLHREVDLYVTPAYAESFAHPLVEAMSSELPIVASDLPVHREICGAASSYFHRFSPHELAQRVCEVASSPGLAAGLVRKGIERASLFSWKLHVERILSLAESVAGAENHRRS
jgi:glycosyltransferase involved in cell wall biosynthesis